MDGIEDLKARAAALDGQQWRRAPMPAPEDALFTSLVRAVAALPAPEREGAAAAPSRAPLNRRGEGFARRVAAPAGRPRAGERLRDAAAALALNGCAARETYMMLSLVHHSATRLGLDGDAILRDAAALAAPDGAQRILRYAATPEKRIASMGWREVEGPDGFDYQ